MLQRLLRTLCKAPQFFIHCVKFKRSCLKCLITFNRKSCLKIKLSFRRLLLAEAKVKPKIMSIPRILIHPIPFIVVSGSALSQKARLLFQCSVSFQTIRFHLLVIELGIKNSIHFFTISVPILLGFYYNNFMPMRLLQQKNMEEVEKWRIAPTALCIMPECIASDAEVLYSCKC